MFAPSFGFGYGSVYWLDLFFSSLATLALFGVFWLIFCLSFKIFSGIMVIVATVLTTLLLIPFNPILFAASFAGGIYGYVKTRRNPIPKQSLFEDPLGVPPRDDLSFARWAFRFISWTHSSGYQEFLESPIISPFDKLHMVFCLTTVGLYFYSTFWSLAAAAVFFFFYCLAYYLLPAVLGFVVVGFTGLTTGMQFGLLVKRIKAQELIKMMKKWEEE